MKTRSGGAYFLSERDGAQVRKLRRELIRLNRSLEPRQLWPDDTGLLIEPIHRDHKAAGKIPPRQQKSSHRKPRPRLGRAALRERTLSKMQEEVDMQIATEIAYYETYVSPLEMGMEEEPLQAGPESESLAEKPPFLFSASPVSLCSTPCVSPVLSQDSRASWSSSTLGHQSPSASSSSSGSSTDYPSTTSSAFPSRNSIGTPDSMDAEPPSLTGHSDTDSSSSFCASPRTLQQQIKAMYELAISPTFVNRNEPYDFWKQNEYSTRLVPMDVSQLARSVKYGRLLKRAN